MADTTKTVRKNLLDLNNPLVVRELNRQMDWIWKKLLGGIQEKDLDPNTTAKIVERTEEIISEKIKTGTVETDELVASLAALMVAQIGIADIDFQKVVDMTTEQAIIKRMMANKVFIEKLVVTEANILSATLGALVLKSSDGKYYTISISSDGTIETEEVVPGEEDIANEVYKGKEIVSDEHGVNIADLDTANLNAQNAIIGKILATALTTGKITAAQATLASASIPELYATAVNALGNSMTFSANSVIQLILGKQNEMQRWFTFNDEEGLVIRKPEIFDKEGNLVHKASIWFTVTDEKGYHVFCDESPEPVGSFEGEGLTVPSVKIGDIRCKRTGTGGWVWTDA